MRDKNTGIVKKGCVSGERLYMMTCPCWCGLEAYLAHGHVERHLGTKTLFIRQVPFYICDQGHIKTELATRLRIKDRVRQAVLEGRTSILF
ncbi:hypothetical protein [Alkalicoccus daliensis]|uniref:Uncharacterized protein n=1 Tax=Alkalicoccus daliensis TaxID=745820 RepID=A0A1H0E8Z8_9BACI|nr:hypothetical protein [Alkalicoccus daliensis]SDN78880.1 hypothetical protein SAMN04488053_103250 [Alkalicoccus daliensis]